MSKSPHLRALVKSFSKSDVFNQNSGFKKHSAPSPFTDAITIKLKKVESNNEDNISPKIYFHEDNEIIKLKDEANSNTEEIKLEIMHNFIKTQKQLIKKVISFKLLFFITLNKL